MFKRLAALLSPGKTAVQTTFTPNTDLNSRATPQDPAITARDLPTEQALCLEVDQAFYDIGRRSSDVKKEQNRCVDPEVYDALENHLVGSFL